MEQMTQTEQIYKRISTGVNGSNENDDIQVSLTALLELKKIMEENNITDDYFIRLATSGGGCAGMIYNIGFDSEKQENDRIFETESINFIIDSKKIIMLFQQLKKNKQKVSKIETLSQIF